MEVWGIKGEVLEERKDFLTFGILGEAREGGNQRENSKKREKSRDLSLESLDSLK